MEPKTWLTVGCLLAALAVVAGAFGAHGLESRLKPAADAIAEARELAERRIHSFETAARYQMYHALALVAVGLIGLHARSTWLNVAGWLFVVGIVLFSGLLYGWVLWQIRPLAMIVPLGGTAFILGWIALAVAAFAANSQRPSNRPSSAAGETAHHAALSH